VCESPCLGFGEFPGHLWGFRAPLGPVACVPAAGGQMGRRPRQRDSSDSRGHLPKSRGRLEQMLQAASGDG
jgi:hypothetical protein